MRTLPLLTLLVVQAASPLLADPTPAAPAATPAPKAATPPPTPTPAPTPAPTPPPKPKKRVPIIAPLQGKVILQYLHPAKTPVHKGEIIAVFDSLHTLSQVEEARARHRESAAATRAATAKVAEAETALKAAREVGQEQITATERARLRYLEGDAPITELNLTLALQDAETAFAQQNDRFEARDKLLAEGFIQKVEYDREGDRQKRAELALKVARARLANFQRFEKAHALEQHDKAVQDKTVALEAKVTEATAKLEAAKREVVTAKKREAEAQAALEAAETVLAATVLRAPEEGVFLPGDPAQPEHPVARGEFVSGGQVLGVIER